MRKLIYLLIIIGIIISSCDNDNTPEDNPSDNDGTYYTFDGEIDGNDRSAIFTYDNNIVICGLNICKNTWLKIDKSGELLWKEDILFDPFCGQLISVTEAENGELLFCGSIDKSSSNQKSDIHVFKTSTDSDTIWTKKYGGDGKDFGCDIIKTSDGNFIVSGKTDNDIVGTQDFCLIKINSNGDTIWTQFYPNNNLDSPHHLIETNDQGYLITGTAQGGGYSELYLVKTDNMGILSWSAKMSFVTYNIGNCSYELEDGSLIIVGSQMENNIRRIFVAKFDQFGNFIWNKDFGTEDFGSYAYSMKRDNDGTFIISGSLYEPDPPKYDILLLKLDANFNELWLKHFGGEESEWGYNVLIDDSEYIITGTTFSFGDDPEDGNIFMVKTDKDGNLK